MRAIIFTLPVLLSSCGAIYTSPQLDQNNELVEVIDVSFDTLSSINAEPYTPKKLPAAFSQTSNRGTTVTTNAIIPDGIEELPPLPTPVQTTVPPRVPNTPYRIGVSDVLLLATPAPSSQEELTGLVAAQNKRQGYTVQDDGSIAVPDVGRIEVSGLTLEEAENAVFNALVDRQIDPKFSIEVAEFKSQSVSVSGAVRQPTLAPISIRPLNLQDALQLAGGLALETNDNAVIRINRNDRLYQIPVKELRAKPSLQRTRLQGGDTVFVDQDYKIEQARAYTQEQLALTQARTSARAQALGEVSLRNSVALSTAEESRQNFLTKLELGAVKRDYAFLAGEVTKQGRFPLPFDNIASLADALYSDSGITTQNGDAARIYLLRLSKTGAPVKAYHIDGSDAVNLLLATKVQLRPDDMIFVSEQRVTAWNRVISQLLPTATIANQAAN